MYQFIVLTLYKWRPSFTRNAITKVRSGHTPMSEMLAKPMVYTRDMILLLFYKKNDINLLFHLAQKRPSWILLTMQCPVCLHHYVRHN